MTFAEGQKATTFEQSLANVANTALDSGSPVKAKMVGPNKYNSYDLKSIEIASASEPKVEVVDEGDIPF